MFDPQCIDRIRFLTVLLGPINKITGRTVNDNVWFIGGYDLVNALVLRNVKF